MQPYTSDHLFLIKKCVQLLRDLDNNFIAYENYNTNKTILLRLRGQPTSYDKWFMRYENPKIQPFCQNFQQPFLATISRLTALDMKFLNRNVNISFRLRGQPTSYDQWFMRCENPKIQPVFAKLLVAIFSHFQQAYSIRHENFEQKCDHFALIEGLSNYKR